MFYNYFLLLIFCLFCSSYADYIIAFNTLDGKPHSYSLNEVKFGKPYYTYTNLTFKDERPGISGFFLIDNRTVIYTLSSKEKMGVMEVYSNNLEYYDLYDIDPPLEGGYSLVRDKKGRLVMLDFHHSQNNIYEAYIDRRRVVIQLVKAVFGVSDEMEVQETALDYDKNVLYMIGTVGGDHKYTSVSLDSYEVVMEYVNITEDNLGHFSYYDNKFYCMKFNENKEFKSLGYYDLDEEKYVPVNYFKLPSNFVTVNDVNFDQKRGLMYISLNMDDVCYWSVVDVKNEKSASYCLSMEQVMEVFTVISE